MYTYGHTQNSICVHMSTYLYTYISTMHMLMYTYLHIYTSYFIFRIVTKVRLPFMFGLGSERLLLIIYLSVAEMAGVLN